MQAADLQQRAQLHQCFITYTKSWLSKKTISSGQVSVMSSRSKLLLAVCTTAAAPASEVEAIVRSPTNMAAAKIAAADFNKMTSLDWPACHVCWARSTSQSTASNASAVLTGRKKSREYLIYVYGVHLLTQRIDADANYKQQGKHCTKTVAPLSRHFHPQGSESFYAARRLLSMPSYLHLCISLDSCNTYRHECSLLFCYILFQLIRFNPVVAS